MQPPCSKETTGSFVPIVLEQLARENGVLLSDRITPCQSGAGTLPQPPADASAAGSIHTQARANQCLVRFLGMEVNTSSFAMYTFSFSVLIQALLLISVSAAADHGRYRKTLLLAFAFAGSIATMLFIFVTANVFYLAALLAVIANTCIGSSFVLLNSFLPLLVRHHPQVQGGGGAYAPVATSENDEPQEMLTEDQQESEREMLSSTTALLTNPSERPDTTTPNPKTPSAASPELALSTKLSSNGIGIGYTAAVIVQTLSVFIVYTSGGSTFSLRLVLFLVGAWWFIFTLPTARWMRPRPGPPLVIAGKASTVTYLTHAWVSLGKTIKQARRLKDVLLFLAAWFLLSDAIATVSGTAILFAKTNLGMKPAALAMINVVVMISGVIGALGWSSVSRKLGLRPSQTILACLCVFEIIPLYALLGYIPAIKRAGVFGFQQPWETYPIGMVYGLVLGGLSSYCRALFGELVPPGMEAAFFALYAITDKGSSVFGPAVVGAITDATGDIRPAFWFLAMLVGLPCLPLAFVDVERGKAEGAALALELEGRHER